MQDPFLNTCINSAGTTICASDWYVDFGERGDSWCDFDLWVMRSGRGHLRAPGEEFALTAGDCFVLKGGVPYLAWADPKNPPTVTHIHFDYLSVAGVPLRPPQHYPVLHRRIRDFPFFERLLDMVVENAVNRGYRNPASRLWLAAALAEIDRHDAAPGFSGSMAGQAHIINIICEEIRADPALKIRLPDLARRLHVTAHHFGRVFKRVRGISPQEFVVSCRMEAAKNLLLNSSHSISRIADILGYSDMYFFSRQFRQRTGISPSGYRK